MSFDDASELQESLDRELELFERLEELRQGASQMRKALAHDIKNPLAVMSGVADLLSTSPDRLTEERSTKLLKALRNSVDQIQALVSDAVSGDWSRMLKPVNIDLAEAARKISADVEVVGTVQVSTHHPGLVEALLEHLLSTVRTLHLSRDEVWVTLRTSGGEAPNPLITAHLSGLLGGELTEIERPEPGTYVRLPP